MNGHKPPETPKILLICCEGKNTEYQYFNITKSHLRLGGRRSRIKVEVISTGHQHKKLVNDAASERQKLLTVLADLEITSNEIETWMVCDSDQMPYSLKELEDYAVTKNVLLAFSNPCFEIVLLQHLCKSSTNQTGKQLDSALTKQLKKEGLATAYTKKDIVWLRQLLYSNPQRLEFAINNCRQISNAQNTPYTNVHALLARMKELAPKPTT